jgi:diadenosine tetraphosphate (Ap4A) HIT family hydrolase
MNTSRERLDGGALRTRKAQDYGVFFRRHAIDLHDLTPDDAAAYMRDIQSLSRSLKEITGAIKLNYEVHGNTIPHLHMHFFPRYVGDPFEGARVNPRALLASAQAAEQHSEIRHRLQAALKQDSEGDVQRE